MCHNLTQNGTDKLNKCHTENTQRTCLEKGNFNRITFCQEQCWTNCFIAEQLMQDNQRLLIKLVYSGLLPIIQKHPEEFQTRQHES